MLEEYALYAFAAGALVGVTALIWLVVCAFRQKVWWGFAVLLFPPAGLLFACYHFRKAVVPVCLFVLAGLLIGAPYAASYYERHFIPLQPYEQVVDGELRITLTGLTNFDYATLDTVRDSALFSLQSNDALTVSPSTFQRPNSRSSHDPWGCCRRTTG